MYRGFNLSVPENFLEQYATDGESLYREKKDLIDSKIRSFKDRDGNLIASHLTANWFPEINCDVFISHSHNNSELATRLSGFLHREVGINSFVDSCVWGYSNDLLRLIDKEYCWQPDSKTYNYAKRNRSTGHVHMMLSVALTKMINRCECLIFINTPKSISSAAYVTGGVTDSPWIYAEIAMTSLIQRRDAAEHRHLRKKEIAMDEALQIKYEVDLRHLTALSMNDIVAWRDKARGHTASNALDKLYLMKS